MIDVLGYTFFSFSECHIIKAVVLQTFLGTLLDAMHGKRALSRVLKELETKSSHGFAKLSYYQLYDSLSLILYILPKCKRKRCLSFFNVFFLLLAV